MANINQVTEHHNCSIIININALQNPEPPAPAQEEEMIEAALKVPSSKRNGSFEGDAEAANINVFHYNKKEKSRTANTTHYNSRHASPDPGIEPPTSQEECRRTRMEQFQSLSSSGPRIKMNNAKWVGNGKKS